MARTLTTGVVAAAVNTSALTTTITAGEAITAGQMITQAADGLAYYAADPNSYNAQFRPLQRTSTATMSAVTPNFLTVSSAYSDWGATTGLSGKNISAMLTNGSIVRLWMTSGATLFSITSLQNDTVIATVTVGSHYFSNSGSVQGQASVCALAGGGFAVAFVDSNNNMSARTYDALGISTGSVSTGMAPAPGRIPMVGLSDGSFVIGCLNPSLYPIYTIRNSVGAAVVASTLLNAGQMPAGNCLDLAALSGGGFVACYGTSQSGTGNGAYQVIANNGTVVKAHTTFCTDYNSSTSRYSAVALTGGGFVLSSVNTVVANQGATAYVFNSSGTLQTSVVLNSAGINNGNGVALCQSTSGGFFAMWPAASSYPQIAKFTAAGAQVGSTISLGSPSITPGYPYAFAIYSTGDDGAVAFIGGGGTSNLFQQILPSGAAGVSLNNFYLGPTINTIYVMNVHITPVSANNVTPLLSVYYFYGTTTACSTIALKIQKQVAVGVSLNSVAAGGAVTVQYTGTATLAAQYLLSYNMNAQSAAQPGQRMSVVGNQVTLQGTMSAAPFSTKLLT